ncbi:MAG: ParB/RepB/Spo0J family partition protein [Bacilli bacterium]|nr:ParB/RepB/Spo0J family partition protein [Bacilli bacterium]
MENKRKALGKGLEQLFNSEPLNIDTLNNYEKEIVETTKESDILEIPIKDIRSNPHQPREYFDEEALKELSESIKDHGIIEPIIVKKSIKGYDLVAGERRTKAAALAGLETIPAIIRDFTDQQMMEIALIENIQREDLSPIEEAQAYKNYIDATGLTQEEVANKFGKSRSYITNLLGLLSLPKYVQKEVINGSISMSHARVLSKIDDVDMILNLAQKVIDDGISVRELETLSKEENIIKKNKINRTVVINPRFKIYESVMRDIVGTKVQISKNKISIPFDTDKDLERILEILNIDIESE